MFIKLQNHEGIQKLLRLHKPLQQKQHQLQQTTTLSCKDWEKTEIVTPERPATVWDMFNNIVNKIDVTPEQKALHSL